MPTQIRNSKGRTAEPACSPRPDTRTIYAVDHDHSWSEQALSGAGGGGRNGAKRLVVTQEDLESVASLFGRIKALRGVPLSRSNEAGMGASLDAHVQVVMRTMKQRLRHLREGALQDAEVLMTKHDLHIVCLQELISITDETNPGLSCVLETLRDTYEKILRSVPGIIRQAIGGHMQEVSHLQEGRKRDAKEAAELVEAAQALEREAVAHHSEARDLRRWLQQLQEENDSLKKNYSGRSSSMQPPTPPRWPVDGHFSPTTTTRVSDCGRGVGRGGGLPSEPSLIATCEFGVKGAERDGVRGDMADGGAGAVSAGRELSLKQLKGVMASIYASKEKYDRRCAAQRLPSQIAVQRLPSQTLARHLDDFLLHRYGLRSVSRIQAIALRQAVEKFQSVDNSVRLFALALRNEVDEHFRLEQRDLERNILEQIRSRLRKRQAVFDKKKIVRGGGSSVDTSYQQQGGAFPVASEATIDSLLRKQTRPGAPLAPGDWQGVVHRLYRNETGEAQTLGFLIREAAFSRRGQGVRTGEDGTRGAASEGHKRRRNIPFGVFVQVLLGYQLHKHLRCLRFFKEDYREVDIDGDGIVNPVQFRRLAKLTIRRAQQSATPSLRREQNYTTGGRPAFDQRAAAAAAAAAAEERPFDDIEDRATARLKAADPFGLGVITFSECVQHLRRDIAAGARLESGRCGLYLGDRRKFDDSRDKGGGKDAVAIATS